MSIERPSTSLREQSTDYELIIIGGGPAGLAAALAAYRKGLRKILIIERDKELGGILNQCIHNGFGLHYFKEELTGPEYAGRFVAMLKDTSIEYSLDTMALEMSPEKIVHCVSKADGYRALSARSVVLAMGCRERARGAVAIPGTRPAGIFTAGAAQRYINLEGLMVGRRVVILGSGDIGLIMARRLTLEGAKVLACVEVMPYSGGLNRNIVQCLHDYDIPLYLSHTVTEILGRQRLERVLVSKVDEDRKPIAGTEMAFDCDTLLLSVGLIPENELTRKAGIELDSRTNGAAVFDNMETSAPGIFACGNVVHVHDLVDFVSAEGERAGEAAAVYALTERANTAGILNLQNGEGVAYTVPQRIRTYPPRIQPDRLDRAAEVFFRVKKIYRNAEICVTSKEKELLTFKRAHMAPGEMEKIHLPKEVLLREKEITISIKENS
jgi:NADPH-dependent 2,4-dienoyl-CoA reductase/sulfur reductase-like enzyme